MAYKMSKGKRSFGDIEYEGDAERNTLIDFDEDRIDLQTGGTVRLQVTNDGVYIPDSPTNASLFVSGGIQLTPGNQEGIRFTNKGNTALNFISFQEGAAASSQDARLGYNSEEYIFISPGRSGDFFISSAENSGDSTYPFSIMDDGTAKFTKGLTSISTRASDLDSSIAFYVSGTRDGNNDAVFDGNVNLNGTTLQGGGQRVKTREVSSFPYTVADDDYIIAVAGTGSPRRINLPAKANHLGRILIIKDASANANSNNIEINPDGSEDIDGAGDKLVNTNKAALTIVCASDQWLVIGNYPG